MRNAPEKRPGRPCSSATPSLRSPARVPAALSPDAPRKALLLSPFQGERRDSSLPPTLPLPARPVSKRSAPVASIPTAGAKAASLSPRPLSFCRNVRTERFGPQAPSFFFGTSVRTVLEAPRQPSAVSQNAARSNARPSPEDSHGEGPRPCAPANKRLPCAGKWDRNSRLHIMHTSAAARVPGGERRLRVKGQGRCGRQTLFSQGDLPWLTSA